MAWEPKDPWGGSGQDPLDEALRKAKDQLTHLVPGRGFIINEPTIVAPRLAGQQIDTQRQLDKYWEDTGELGCESMRAFARATHGLVEVGEFLPEIHLDARVIQGMAFDGGLELL